MRKATRCEWWLKPAAVREDSPPRPPVYQEEVQKPELLGGRRGAGRRIRNAHSINLSHAGKRSVSLQPKFQIEIRGIQKTHQSHRPRAALLGFRAGQFISGFAQQASDQTFYLRDFAF